MSDTTTTKPDTLSTAPVPKPIGVDVARVSITLTQDADCCDGGMGQALEIETEDGGAGPFLVIKTERWAFDADQIPGLVAAFEAVLRMAGADLSKL